MRPLCRTCGFVRSTSIQDCASHCATVHLRGSSCKFDAIGIVRDNGPHSAVGSVIVVNVVVVVVVVVFVVVVFVVVVVVVIFVFDFVVIAIVASTFHSSFPLQLPIPTSRMVGSFDPEK